MHRLLHRHRFGQVSWEIHVEPFADSKPVGDQLERNHVQQTLQAIYRLGYLNSVRFLSGELRVVRIAEDNWAAFAGDH